MLVNMKELLKVAQENRFAVPAFNIGSLEILKAVVEVAEETYSPVILEIHPEELSYLGEEFIETVKLTAYRSNVPMVIHLDHGGSYEEVMQAIRCGFTSVMIDGSTLVYENNVKETKKVVEAAHCLNVSVEAELGTIGTTSTSMEGGTDAIIYTDPLQAKKFVEQTGIDTLAIAIGTSHGLYPKNCKPQLRLDILTDIKEMVNIPLVLHGGSGNSDEEVSKAVDLGICKVNISSDIKSVFFNELKAYLEKNPNSYEPNSIFPSCIEKSKEVIKYKLDLFNSLGKACLYK